MMNYLQSLSEWHLSLGEAIGLTHRATGLILLDRDSYLFLAVTLRLHAETSVRWHYLEISSSS